MDVVSFIFTMITKSFITDVDKRLNKQSAYCKLSFCYIYMQKML